MDKKRTFLFRALESGLDCGVLDANDVLRQVTMSMLAENLPKPLLANLIKAGLKKKTFDAELIVGTLGIRALATHMPVNALWLVVSEAATRLLAGAELKPAKAAAKSKSKSKADAPKAKGAKAKDGKAEKAKDAKAKDKDGKTKSEKAKDEKAKDEKAKDEKAKDEKAKDEKAKDEKAKVEKTKPADAKAADKSPPRPRPKGNGKVEAPIAPAPIVEVVEVEEMGVDVELVDEAALAGATVEMATGGPEAVPERKPNLSSRPDTAPGLIAKAESRTKGPMPARLPGVPMVEEAEGTASSPHPLPSDFDIDTKVSAVPEPPGRPPPRAPTFDPEVENALDSLEMDPLLEEFEVGEDEILDDSVNFDDVTGTIKK